MLINKRKEKPMKWIKTNGGGEMLKVNNHYIGRILPNPEHDFKWAWWAFPPAEARIKADSPKGRAVSQSDAKRVVVAILMAAGALNSQDVPVLDFMAGWEREN
jgi:hypothetical protein